jgi:hypothetical protein
VAASTEAPLPSDDASSRPEPAGNGCARNNVAIPADARRVRSADLDLDGEADTLWLADVAGKRTVGVRTATGATFSTVFSSAAPQQAIAIAQKMAPAGPAIVLLDAGRSVLLFDVVDCQLVPTKNKQGAQYIFDKGFTSYGTGVECTRNGSEYTLAGLLAQPESSNTGVTVFRTTIALSDFGRQARNGTRQTVVAHASSSDPRVRHAQTVSCGTPSASVTEPRSS